MIEAIACGIYEDIKDFILPNQFIKYSDGVDWYGNRHDDPNITISTCNSPRYAVIRFILDECVLDTEIMFFTKYYQLNEELQIDLFDPQGLQQLEYWILTETIDGLKRGYSDRVEKRVPILKRLQPPSIETQLELELA